MTSEDDNRRSGRPRDGPPRTADSAITNEAAFQRALQTLVVEATSNGVDVRGGWPVSPDGDTEAWDIEITRVTRRTTAHVRDTESTATTVIEAVAAREDVDPTELPPLHATIGPEIIEKLQQSSDEAQQYVTFQYYGYQITIRSDGSILLDG